MQGQPWRIRDGQRLIIRMLIKAAGGGSDVTALRWTPLASRFLVKVKSQTRELLTLTPGTDKAVTQRRQRDFGKL